MSKSISLAQFKADLEPIRAEYVAKQKEVHALKAKFKALANQVHAENRPPDELGITDWESEEYSKKEDAYLAEIDMIENIISDLVYDFDLEWSGSFNEGSNYFWVPSTC